MKSPRKPVDVAAGVLFRPDGRFLLASRPAGKPYASYWEFPGGKLEAGESIAAALARELHEELGIDIETPLPWVVRVFDYPHARVRLHFCRVYQWSGELHAREGQQFGYFAAHDLPAGPLLPATIPVLRWLQLPPVYAISATTLLGRDLFLRRLEVALAGGLKLLQFREPLLDAAEAALIFNEVNARAHAAGATVLVSSRHARQLWDQADGVHLTAADLAATTKRPDAAWVAASVHTRSEIERAAALDLDFVVAGPVRPTATHLQPKPLGWNTFAHLIAGAALPVYALGGMRAQDVAQAMRCGAHGIASLSAVWSEDERAVHDSGSRSASLADVPIE